MDVACFPAGYALHVGGRGMEQIKLVEKEVPNGTGVWLFPLVHVEQEAFTKTNPSGAPAPPPFQQGRQIVLHVAGRGME